MVKRFERSVPVQVVPASRAAVSTSDTLTQALDDFKQGQTERMQRQAVARETTAGQTAGSEPGAPPQLREGFGVADTAFNRAAIASYNARVRNEIRAKSAELEARHDADPDGFDTGFTGFADGLTQDLDERLKPFVQNELAFQRSTRLNRITERQRQRIQAENLASITEDLDGLQSDIAEAARAGDIDRAAALEEEFNDALDIGGTPDENNDVLLTPQQVSAARDSVRDSVNTQLALGQFERELEAGGVDAGKAAIERFRKSKKTGLDPTQKDRLTTSMNTLLNRAIAEDNRQRALARADLAARRDGVRAQARDAIDLMDEGLAPDEQNLTDTLAATAADPELAGLHADLVETAEFLPVHRALSNMSRAEREAAISAQEASLRTGTADARQLRDLERAKKLNQAQNTALEQDSLGYAIQQGVVDSAPLNFGGDLEENLKIVADRRDDIRQAEALYGHPVSPITAAEASQLAAFMNETTAPEAAEVLGAMTGILGPDAVEAYAQIDKAGATQHAFAGGLFVDGSPTAAQHVLRGVDVLKNNRNVIPQGAIIDPEINERLDNAYLHNPRHRGAVHDSIRAAYASLITAKGIVDTDEVDGGVMDDAVTLVTGGLVEHRSRLMEAPARGMDQDAFEEWIEGVTAEKIDELGGVAGFASSTIAEQLRDGDLGLVNVGRGRYLVVGEHAIGVEAAYQRADNTGPFELVY